jgi:creatinine amidohydrolase
LPVGTCLQHGPHLPLGADTIVVERLAQAVSEKTGILVAPTLAYGVSSDVERSYAGSAALERKTLHRVLNELVDSWERQGLEEIVLMTAHGYGPHIQAMAAVVADFVRVRAVDIHAIDLAAFLRGGSEAEHAGEMDTAILLHLAPELVREDRVADGEPGGRILRSVRDEPVPPMGSPGVVGRPSLATRESGRRICEYLVDYISRRLEA